MVGSLLGSQAVALMSPVRLKQVFAAFLVVVALYPGAQSITALIRP